MPAIELYERYLTSYVDQRLRSIPGVIVLGLGDKVCCISFTVAGMNPQALGPQARAIRSYAQDGCSLET
jgi:selenocysteine lyase/cysteine desulfurase